MEGIRQYLLTVVCAAIFCAIIFHFFDKKGSNAVVIKLVTGLFMAITIISPIKSLEFANLTDFTYNLSTDAENTAIAGQELAQKELCAIITEKTEAYIHDKATALGLDVTISVELNTGIPPTPSAVTIFGNVSPYAKSVLSRYIESNLAIPEENQLWI